MADDGGRRAEGGGRRAERTARPKPTGWKARATWHGLSSPCRGDRGSRRSRIAAHAIWQRTDGRGASRGRRTTEGGRLTADGGGRTTDFSLCSCAEPDWAYG